MADPEIVVVGAGAAGLAAAAWLRAHGRSVMVLEADSRIGGRARTSKPAELRGAAIDEGATWLHQVDRNPLLELARAAGEALHVAHQGGRRLVIGGRVVGEHEAAEYEAADTAWRDCAARLAEGPDQALSAVGDACAASPWTGNVEAWEGAVIAAADADGLSLHDWHRNELADGDLRPDCGMGTLLARRLGPQAGPVRLGVTVRTVDWSRPGGVELSTSAGRLRAGACIVTVSTGVLRDGRIGFLPSLPDDVANALDGLPMGLLSKLALPGRDDDALSLLQVEPGTLPGSLIERRLERRGDPLLLLGVCPDGAPYVTGFLGGRHAWSFARHETDALQEMRAELGRSLGAAAAGALAADGYASRWGSDPLFLGAYAYARPGHAEARGRLGRPFADGRVVLAGEACCTDGLAGTVGGAMRDGERAARAVAALMDKTRSLTG